MHPFAGEGYYLFTNKNYAVIKLPCGKTWPDLIFFSRGPFVTALGKTWCAEHFHCVNAQCRRPLQDIGFVEEQGQLYCEHCYETYLAPVCNKCTARIKGVSQDRVDRGPSNPEFPLPSNTSALLALILVPCIEYVIVFDFLSMQIAVALT